jgi:hypothetical protein
MRGQRALVLSCALVVAIGARSIAAPSSAVLASSIGVEHATDDERADAARSTDRAAVDAYRGGDLDSARSLWLSMIDPAPSANGGDGAKSAEARGAANADARDAARGTLSSDERARILYDLGNVAYRKKQTLEAVGWYTAALRLSPRDPDIWWNLEHARSEAKLEPADRGDLEATLRRLVSSLTLAESEWLVLGTLGAWAAVLAVEALRGGRTWRRLSLAGAACVVVCLGPWLFNLSRASRHPVLAIQEGKLQVKSEPRADAPAIAEVAAGDEIERLDELPEWTKVELASGVQGWARKSALFALDR